MRTRISPDNETIQGPRPDTAVVLSGGSINGIFLQLGFLQALRESELWSRIGWVYGTSAGALSGWATALDALDDHEGFLMQLQPEDVFAAHDLWRLPFVGLHRYALPETVAERLGDPVELARRLQEGTRELTVVTTDVGLSADSAVQADPFERAFSSREETAQTLADAIFASAAISTFVLPLRIGESVYADGGWVRNFPLSYAYHEPRATAIVGCRYCPSPAGSPGRGLHSWHERMSRLARIRVARGVTAELRDAVERHERGEPTHLVDTIARLSHIAIYRNSGLEVQLADERDRSLLALDGMRAQMRAAIESSTRGRRRTELLRALDHAFDSADFPFLRSRVVPRLVVDVATPDGTRLDITRRPSTWSDDDKLALAAHGRRLTEEALATWDAASSVQTAA
jgi:predicted acylesterase/phospholipase RssA